MARLVEILFPLEPRRLPGQRWINILLRCLHLVGVCGSGAGLLAGSDPAAASGAVPVFWALALASGFALSALYLAASGRWLLEWKGAAIVLKLLLLLAGSVMPAARPAVFIAVVVISGLIAHAPAAVRNRGLVARPGAPPGSPRHCA